MPPDSWATTKVVIAAVAAIAAVLSVLYAARAAAAARGSEASARRSADAAERSANIAERSAKAAEASAQTSAESLEMRRAPRMIADHGLHDGKYGIIIRNAGEGTAYGVIADLMRQDEQPSQAQPKPYHEECAALTNDGVLLHRRSGVGRYADVWGTITCKDSIGRIWRSEKTKGGEWSCSCEDPGLREKQ